MEFRVKHQPVFSVVEFDLNADEVIISQPNSMLTMTSGIQIKAAVGRGRKPGWRSGFGSLLGGESFFTAEFTASKNDQMLTLAPDAYGDIVVIELLNAGGFYLTRGSYLANSGDCELKTKYGGLKGLMSKKGLFLLHASGEGIVFCQTYGAVIDKVLDDGEVFFVDNRFVVAFSDTVQYQLVKATESVKDSLMSGEGLVNRYTGPGRLIYQTRSKPGSGVLGKILDAAT
ncbi:MAG: TIGR00266 family protein [Planctomycetota bacterium]|nr:TIGR00266 family protein [Planctomycetota bacterium]